MTLWVGCQGGPYSHQGDEKRAPYGPLVRHSLLPLPQSSVSSLSPSPSRVPSFSGKPLSEDLGNVDMNLLQKTKYVYRPRTVEPRRLPLSRIRTLLLGARQTSRTWSVYYSSQVCPILYDTSCLFFFTFLFAPFSLLNWKVRLKTSRKSTFHHER